VSVVLRSDQRAAVEALYAHLRAGVRRVLVQAPTGWGKGTVAAELMRRAEAQGKRAVFISHLADINRDIAARARAYGCQRVGVLMGSAPEGDENPAVVVATVQTLFARRAERPAADLVIWDECHRAAASSYADVRAAYPAAAHVGFSATPERADGATLGDAFDALIPGPSPLELVALGCLAPVRVLAPTETTQALARDPAEAWPAGSPGVLFAHSLAHSRECADRLRARGIRAAHVDADTRDREHLIRAFNAGELDVLSCFRLFVEGVDVPRAEVVMLGTLFGHAGAFLQAVGRGRRVAPSKAGCTVVDLRGNVHRHGLPDEARTYHLDGEAIRRAERLPSIVQCKQCHAWGPGGQVCSACGAQLPPPPPPRVLARDLVEVRARTDSGEDRFARLCRFVADAVAKGRNPWSAAHRYRGTYGETPARGDMVAAIRRTGE
jgi:superfamily II DNA or RNA helicase